MTDKERYKKMFDTVSSFGMMQLEADTLMKKTKKHAYMGTAAAIAAAVLIAGSTGIAYAANVGGIQRTIQLWIHGDQTNAELVIGNGEYNITWKSEDGSEQTMGGGGIAFEPDGTERPLTEAELLEQLYMPEVEYKEDGTVWVYYYNQEIDITDRFENGICYVKLVNGDETLYMTVKYNDGYSISHDKYVDPS